MKSQRRYANHYTVKQNIKKIIELKKMGLNHTQLAKRFGVSSHFIGELLAASRPVAIPDMP